MRFARAIFIFSAVFVALSAFASEGEEAEKRTLVIRPDLVVIGDGCIATAKEGTLEVTKGTLIEIDYGYIYQPSCIPNVITCEPTGNGVIKKSSLGEWQIGNGSIGGYVTTGYFFRAKKRGSDTLTLTIDGVAYHYEIHVR